MANETPDLVMPTTIVLNELDEFAKQWDEIRLHDGSWQCRRNRQRRKFRTACDIWFFENGGRSIRSLSAQTRNLSEQGIGLLTRCLILQGVPLEVRIQVPHRDPLFMAGVAVFCRYAQLGLHEVGVSLKACQNSPILSEDPLKAVALTPWLQQAIKNLRLAADIAKAQPIVDRSESKPQQGGVIWRR